MKRGTTFILMAAAFALAWPAASPLAQRRQAASGVRLVEAGGFHGDEVSARTGETWLGLYVSEGRSSLAPSVVEVVPEHDPVVDEEPWQKTGKAVSVVNRKDEPLFLIAGAAALKPGPVVTSRAEEATLASGANVSLRLAGAVYSLRVLNGGGRAGQIALPADARLVLSKGRATQVLYGMGAEGGGVDHHEWRLLWAGDLDGDRGLDLYVQVSDHYNVIEHRLFLSSRAGRKRLVREVAVFRMVGC